MLLQVAPPTSTGFVNWAVVAALLTTVVTIGTKWLIPSLIQFMGRGGTDTVESNLTAEWRGKTSTQLDQQDKRLDALVEATTNIAQVVAELARRSQGTELAIRTITEMAPKIDVIYTRGK